MCILVVEDEPLIRELVADYLDIHGFEVCEAETGDEAAELIARPVTAFRMLITDIHMPGRLNGIDVGRLMRRAHPMLPIIYTTGRPDALYGLGPLASNEAVVLKPYTPAELLRAVQALLAA